MGRLQVDGKNLQRGLRRHHRFRMRKHAARLIRLGVSNLPGSAAWIRRSICRRGDTYTVCSDPGCCGNPRRRWGSLTRQESLAEICFEEERLEL